MNEFVMMRVESNYGPGTFQQLGLALLRGLTCRLYSLRYRVEALKSKLEVRATALFHFVMSLMTASQLEIDERQLSMTESASSTVVPGPAAGTHIF